MRVCGNEFQNDFHNFRAAQNIVLLKKFGRNPKCDRDWCENEIKKN